MEDSIVDAYGRGDAGLQAAWEFEEHPNKYTYEELMRYVPEANRAAWHAKAMDATAKADLHSQIELWLETEERDRLVERLRRASDEDLEGTSHYATEPAAKLLAETHPDVAAKVYRALGLRILKKKSKYYGAAHLEETRRCYERAGLRTSGRRSCAQFAPTTVARSGSREGSRRSSQVPDRARSPPFSSGRRRAGQGLPLGDRAKGTED